MTEDKVTYFKLNNEINRPVNGKIPLHKDKEAVVAYFKEHVNPNTVYFNTLEEKLEYLTTNGFIERAFLDKYTFKFIKKLFHRMYNKNFKFRSFMGAHKFYSQYALKTNDGKKYLERFEDRLAFNALFLANGDEKLALDIGEELINQRYQPATPTFMNAGRQSRGDFVSCFLLETTDDMNSIGRVINSALQLSKGGGGVGINASNLREAGAPIKKIKNAASGVVPVMKLLEDSFTYANQLGTRQGAGVVYLNVFHPDVMDFLSTKKENADEKVRIKTLSLGLVVPDKFYELTKNNDVMYLFSPYDVEREYGTPFSYVDITTEYDNMVNNSDIRKYEVNARDVENEISKLQQESGYPYIVNIDTANRESAVPGKIVMSNVCSEILQPMKPSVIGNDQNYIEMGEDISCNLGSTNIVNLMEQKDHHFGRSIRTMVRALTFVTDTSNIDTVPTVVNGNNKNHTIGLGAMGLHAFLAKNHIQYESAEAVEFTSIYFYLLRYHAMVESMMIATERGESFASFKQSKYYTGEFFDKYIERDFSPKLPKVKELFKGIPIPCRDEWKMLKNAVHDRGLYHMELLAVAPTGSISYVNETTSSIHPIIQRIEERQEKKTGTTYYPAAYLSEDTMPYYKSAYDIDMRWMIDVHAAAQEHVDQGISMTLYLKEDIPLGLYHWKGTETKQTTRDLNILRNYAWSKNIKTIYYVRTYRSADQEVGSNQCESCSI